jgi:hypothetical protein
VTRGEALAADEDEIDGRVIEHGMCGVHGLSPCRDDSRPRACGCGQWEMLP